MQTFGTSKEAKVDTIVKTILTDYQKSSGIVCWEEVCAIFQPILTGGAVVANQADILFPRAKPATRAWSIQCGSIVPVRAGPWGERDTLKRTTPTFAYALDVGHKV